MTARTPPALGADGFHPASMSSIVIGSMRGLLNATGDRQKQSPLPAGA